jgi:hypothetical protein
MQVSVFCFSRLQTQLPPLCLRRPSPRPLWGSSVARTTATRVFRLDLAPRRRRPSPPRLAPRRLGSTATVAVTACCARCKLRERLGRRRPSPPRLARRLARRITAITACCCASCELRKQRLAGLVAAARFLLLDLLLDLVSSSLARARRLLAARLLPGARRG